MVSDSLIFKNECRVFILLRSEVAHWRGQARVSHTHECPVEIHAHSGIHYDHAGGWECGSSGKIQWLEDPTKK